MEFAYVNDFECRLFKMQTSEVAETHAWVWEYLL